VKRFFSKKENNSAAKNKEAQAKIKKNEINFKIN
jgi:hypothetical protein